jgi:hypothetical protein
LKSLHDCQGVEHAFRPAESFRLAMGFSPWGSQRLKPHALCRLLRSAKALLHPKSKSAQHQSCRYTNPSETPGSPL